MVESSETTDKKATLVDGRYRLLEQLGAGSMGIVYRAEDVFLERVVALKFIDPVQQRDAKNVERFLKEARSLAKIRHPNVVQVYAFGEHERSHFFAMEYVAGASLESRIDEASERGQTLPMDHIREMSRALAAGLDAVHEGHLVHRDVKPGNIVLEASTGRAVLIDFGLARRKSASSPRFSITAGTPMYMAPEQARDPDGTKVTPRADQYALACTVFEMLAGRPVFLGNDVYEILLSHFKTPPPRISSLKPELAPLDDALIKALSKEPGDRHPSCGTFMAALEAGFSKVAMAAPESSHTIPAQPMVGPEETVLLLVDDESLSRRITKLVGKELEGAKRHAFVSSFRAPEEAWEWLRQNEPGIMVIDEAAMGTLPIEELVANVRRLAKNANLLILSREWQDVRVTVGGPKCDVLPKPLNVQMLTGAITRIVSRRSTHD